MRKRVVLIIVGATLVAVSGGVLTVMTQDSADVATGEYCVTLKQVLEPPAPAGSPAERFAKVDALAAALADQAPKHLKTDVATYANGVRGFVIELSKVGYEFAKLSPEQMGALQTPEMTAAASVVMKSADVDCHLSSASPTAAPPESPQDAGPTPSKFAETTTPSNAETTGGNTTAPPPST